MQFAHTKQDGFTLIELLVVIAIIGVLSSVVLASLNVTRAKARDAQRFHELREIQKALELYYSDAGEYPMYLGWPGCSGGWAIDYAGYTNCWDDLKTKLSPYINLPSDPLEENTGYTYQYSGQTSANWPNYITSGYILQARMEQSVSNNPDYPDCGGAGGNPEYFCLVGGREY